MQFVEQLPLGAPVRHPVLPGRRRLSLFLVLLTTLITVLVLLFSWGRGGEEPEGLPGAHAGGSEAGMVGVFVALDLVLFYIFWELTLIRCTSSSAAGATLTARTPSWAGHGVASMRPSNSSCTRSSATLMLVAILVLYAQGGTFDVLKLQALNLAPNLQDVALPGLRAGLRHQGADLPLPHLAARHVAAPTSGSVILAAVLLKMGTYGFVRFCLPLFPEATPHLRAVDLAGLAIVGILLLVRWSPWCRRTSRRSWPTPPWRTWGSSCWGSWPWTRRVSRKRRCRWSTMG